MCVCVCVCVYVLRVCVCVLRVCVCVLGYGCKCIYACVGICVLVDM